MVPVSMKHARLTRSLDVFLYEEGQQTNFDVVLEEQENDACGTYTPTRLPHFHDRLSCVRTCVRVRR